MFLAFAFFVVVFALLILPSIRVKDFSAYFYRHAVGALASLSLGIAGLFQGESLWLSGGIVALLVLALTPTTLRILKLRSQIDSKGLDKAIQIYIREKHLGGKLDGDPWAAAHHLISSAFGNVRDVPEVSRAIDDAVSELISNEAVKITLR